MHPHFWWVRGGGWGCWTSYQIFEKVEGLDRILIFKGELWEREGWPFWAEGYNSYMTIKLKSEIFNNKNSL